MGVGMLGCILSNVDVLPHDIFYLSTCARASTDKKGKIALMYNLLYDNLCACDFIHQTLHPITHH